MAKKKKRVSQTQFDRKIKIWTVIVPLIVSVITSATSLGVVLISRQPQKVNVVRLKDIMVENKDITSPFSPKQKQNLALGVVADPGNKHEKKAEKMPATETPQQMAEMAESETLSKPLPPFNDFELKAIEGKLLELINYTYKLICGTFASFVGAEPTT